MERHIRQPKSYFKESISYSYILYNLLKINRKFHRKVTVYDYTLSYSRL